jgi:tetratricopeptide (TPR) repeat protein
MGYAVLGVSYANFGETELAAENTRKAYELRDRVSQIERFLIDSFYYRFAIGDLEKALQSFALWAKTYPRDWNPTIHLSIIYAILGHWDKALEESRETVRLDPAGLNYSVLVATYLTLSRLEEAKSSIGEAQAKNLDSPGLRFDLYVLGFLQKDTTGMAQQIAWSAGKPGVEDAMLALDADTAAFFGRLQKAREISRRAVASAEQAGEKEVAASYKADAAFREALYGNPAEARQLAGEALRVSKGRDAQYQAALALALTSDAARADSIADDLGKHAPENTIVQFMYLPTVHALISLARKDSSKTVDVLQPATPYDLGSPGSGAFALALYPVYVRGIAYLSAHQGKEAAAEFQKILDNPGLVINEPIAPLAHLQIGRAYAMQGDATRARAAYQEFLTLWKDADSDIPILIAAKSEYAKLQ